MNSAAAGRSDARNLFGFVVLTLGMPAMAALFVLALKVGNASATFNTGDTYRLSSTNENLDPEKSVNFEIGAKLDSADKRYTTRLALFQATKFNERNTDPDNAAATPLKCR